MMPEDFRRLIYLMPMMALVEMAGEIATTVTTLAAFKMVPLQNMSFILAQVIATLNIVSAAQLTMRSVMQPVKMR